MNAPVGQIVIAAISLGFSIWCCSAIAAPEATPDGNRDAEPSAVERADDLNNKLTFSVYYVPGEPGYDLNFRHRFGAVVAWIGAIIDPAASSQGRFGAEYDLQYEWLFLKPTLEVNTSGAVMGSLYSELGRTFYAIVGFSRTNLRPFNDLFFDPNDSAQLGAGYNLNSYDKIAAYSIFDVRLHTHQQNTHFLWRYRIDDYNGITLDGLFKSGYTDEDKYIRAVGIGIYYDRPTWFWKAYYDPHVNFTRHDMVRLGVGLKF